METVLTFHGQIQSDYSDTLLVGDRGKLKRLINSVRGFQSKQTAYATIRGFEVMRMFRKGQMDLWYCGQGIAGEVRLVQSQFVF